MPGLYAAIVELIDVREQIAEQISSDALERVFDDYFDMNDLGAEVIHQFALHACCDRSVISCAADEIQKVVGSGARHLEDSRPLMPIINQHQVTDGQTFGRDALSHGVA